MVAEDPHCPADSHCPADPHREDVYRAEALAMPDGGRRFARFTQIATFVDEVVTSGWWDDTFPDAPIEVTVMRRSRNATFSAATVDTGAHAGAIWIREGSWDMVTVLHELAHLASAQGNDPGVGSDARTFTTEVGDPTGPHGQWFTAALGELWRRYLGFHAYGALQSGLAARGVPFRRDLRP